MTYPRFLLLLWCLLVIATSYSKEKFPDDSIRFYINKSKEYLFDNKSKSLIYIAKAERLVPKSSDQSLKYEIYYSRGAVYYVSADYDKALENFLLALDGFESLVNVRPELIAKCITGLGLVEMGLENYPYSMKYFHQASKIKSPEQGYMNAANFFNLGIAHMELRQLDSSRHFLDKSLKLSIKHERTSTEHMVLNRLGELMIIQNAPDSAWFYFDKLKNHATPMSLWEQTFYNRGLAQFYILKSDFLKAQEHAIIALELAHKIPSKWEIYKCYEILSKVEKVKKNYKGAFEYLELHNQYKDSVINENQIRKIKYLQLQKKENENELLKMENSLYEKQLRNSKIITYLSVAISFLFLVAMYFMFNYARTKSSLSKKLKLSNENIAIQNESLENLNELKTRLLSILSHDVKSPLASIEQVLRLFNEKILDRQERDELLTKLHPQVKDTIDMVNNMVYWAQNQIKGTYQHSELIEIQDVLKAVIQSLKLKSDLKNISIQFSENNLPKVLADYNHLQIIFQNLLSNAIKFSNPNQKVKIFTEVTQHDIRIHFKDSGKGLEAHEIESLLNSEGPIPSKMGTYNETGTGLGMTLVKQLLQKESGTLEIKSKPGKGSDFIVCLPLVDKIQNNE